MSLIPSKSSQTTREDFRGKRASVGAFPASVPYVAPLNISSKKGSRAPITNTAATPSATNAPIPTMTTPTMPAKSSFRMSLDSPGSLNYTPPTGVRSRISMSPGTADFVHGIGLDFGSPESAFLSCSSSFASRVPQNADALSAAGGELASKLTRPISIASSDSKEGMFGPLNGEGVPDPRAEEDRSDTSPSSVASSVPDKSELTLPLHAKSHDAVFSHARFDYDVVATPKRASLLSAIPMGISRSHQDFIDGSPTTFQRNEAEGLFKSVRGLMADLRFDIDHDQRRHAEPSGVPAAVQTRDGVRETVQVEVAQDLRSWLADPQRNQERPSERSETEEAQDIGMPHIKVAVTPTSPLPTSSGESTLDAAETPVKRAIQQTLEPPQPALPAATEDGTSGANSLKRGLWGLLRAPSPSSKPVASTRSPSASSYSSITSFIDPSTSPGAANNTSTSSLLSNSSFSLFGRKFITRSVSDTRVSSSTTHNDDDDLRLRLPRREVDEAKLADLIISCADARHILKTDTSPTRLKQVGLKLELGWREQLAEAQQLRNRLEVTQDTVEDLEDENNHLRSQLGGLSEQIVSREDDMKRLAQATEMQISRERAKVEAELQAAKAEVAVEVAQLQRSLAEEKAFAVGLGMLLSEKAQRVSGLFAAHLSSASMEPDSESSLDVSTPGAQDTSRPSSVLFDVLNDTEGVGVGGSGGFSKQVRRSALLQARPTRAEIADQVLGAAYDELFRCTVHRFAQGAAAPPSTLVNERVLLIGTDHRLLLALAQKLVGLGLTQVLWAIPAWDGSRSPRTVRASGVPRISFDPTEEHAWTALANEARKTFGGEVDCVVNAFDQLDAHRLAAVSSLLRQQASVVSVESTVQPLNVVSVVYDAQHDQIDTDSVDTSMYTMAMIGLTGSLALQNSCLSRCASSRAVRMNTVVLAQSGSAPASSALDAILRLLDPCSFIQGCVLHPGANSHVHCMGPPLCPALPALYTSPTLSSPSNNRRHPSKSLLDPNAIQPERQAWLRTHKRIADLELVDALQLEIVALRTRLQALEQRALQVA